MKRIFYQAIKATLMSSIYTLRKISIFSDYMETFEHKILGDQIRIETFDNHYLKNSKTLSFDNNNNLRLTPMRMSGGIPIPVKVEISAGDIVALAGDYFTKAGWGNSLQISRTVGDREGYQELLKNKIQESEKNAFLEAYHDLASNSLTQILIDRIYTIEKVFPGDSQHAVYAAMVKNYSAKLKNNTAHFSPWSLRAYLVGHENALEMAKLAYHCKKIVENQEDLLDMNSLKNNPELKEERFQLLSAIALIKGNPEYYQFESLLSGECSEDEKDNIILIELSHRYHAAAVAQDLFAMHFYSDHFAAGHSSRIGMMRTTLPQQFGLWGSILVNSMHNEDNNFSIPVTNSLAISDKSDADDFHMIQEKSKAYGDYTYLSRDNSDTRNLLINGMDNSLGDISRLLVDGQKRDYQHFGCLSFLPTIDFSKRQLMPLFIQDSQNKIYVRSNIKWVDTLGPLTYQKAMQNPQAYGYEPLTYWKAFLLVIKLRLLGMFYSATVNPNFDKNKIENEEATFTQIEKESPILHTHKIQPLTSVLINSKLELENLATQPENGKLEITDIGHEYQPISEPRLLNPNFSLEENNLPQAVKSNWRNNSKPSVIRDFFSLFKKANIEKDSDPRNVKNHSKIQ